MRPCAIAADPAFKRLKSFLIETTGLAYYETRDEQLAPLLQQRLDDLGLACDEYLAHLHCHDNEIDRVVCDLTIGETHFFRHVELFNALRDRVLPEVLRNDLPLRIWSAGSSIGAEAYSLAILLRRDLAHIVGTRSVTIIGTDINRRFLARARKGRFGDWALRGVSDDLVRGCFRRLDGEWEIRPEFREGVSFRHHNLVTEPFPCEDLTGFDVVLCRNVMIYFEPPVIHRLLRQLAASVVPGGWFLVGHADPGPDPSLGLEPVCAPGAVLYRRRDVFTPVTPPAPAPLRVRTRPVRRRSPVPVPVPEPGPKHEPGAHDEMRSCLDRGDWDAGIALANRALEQDPLATRAYYHRALALEQSGRRDEAERDFRRVLYLDRGHALAHFQLGRLLLDASRHPEAESLLRAADSLLAHRAEADPAGDGTDLTVRELRSLVRVHAGGIKE